MREPIHATPACPAVVNDQEAKTHLSGLLVRVAAGEEILLARNGIPVLAWPL